MQINIASFWQGMPERLYRNPENQNEYRKWLGRLTDPMATPDERREAMNQEFAFRPACDQRQQLKHA